MSSFFGAILDRIQGRRTHEEMVLVDGGGKENICFTSKKALVEGEKRKLFYLGDGVGGVGGERRE